MTGRLELPGDCREGQSWAGGPSPCCSVARTGDLLQLMCSQGLCSPADIIISTTAALRSKYKRATILQLHQWHGKVRETVKKQETNKHKKVPTSEEKRQIKVKGKSLNSYFSKNKILSSKGIESRVSKRYLYTRVHRALFAIAKRSRNPSVH